MKGQLYRKAIAFARGRAPARELKRLQLCPVRKWLLTIVRPRSHGGGCMRAKRLVKPGCDLKCGA